MGAFQPRRFPATSARGAVDPQILTKFCLLEIPVHRRNATELLNYAFDLNHRRLKTSFPATMCFLRV